MMYMKEHNIILSLLGLKKSESRIDHETTTEKSTTRRTIPPFLRARAWKPRIFVVELLNSLLD